MSLNSQFSYDEVTGLIVTIVKVRGWDWMRWTCLIESPDKLRDRTANVPFIFLPASTEPRCEVGDFILNVACCSSLPYCHASGNLCHTTVSASSSTYTSCVPSKAF